MAETKVILTKSVNHLGHPGDVVSVKAGYARNYLIPQGLGFAWSKNAAAQIEAMKRARLAKAVATREEAVAAKELIEGSVVEIAAKVSESGKLFGGISADKIAIALSSKLPSTRRTSPWIRSRPPASSLQPSLCTRKSPLPSP